MELAPPYVMSATLSRVHSGLGSLPLPDQASVVSEAQRQSSTDASGA